MTPCNKISSSLSNSLESAFSNLILNVVAVFLPIMKIPNLIKTERITVSPIDEKSGNELNKQNKIVSAIKIQYVIPNCSKVTFIVLSTLRLKLLWLVKYTFAFLMLVRLLSFKKEGVLREISPQYVGSIPSTAFG